MAGQVCKFYLQGNCKFGSRCYNAHPPKNQQGFNNMGRGQNPNGGRYNSGSSWRGGQGNNDAWRENNNWKSGSGNNWEGSGGNNWGGGHGGRGGGTNNSWNGGGNNWRGGGNGNGRNNSTWDNNRGSSGGWHGNSNRGGNTWQPKGGINWSNWEFDADNWTSDNPSDMRRGDNVFFRNIAEDMDTTDDNHNISSDINEIIKTDISLWLQRGIWPLSCYTPSPLSCQSLPGLDDYSQEEIRWEAQIATLQRNPQAYHDSVQELMERRKLLWQHYVQLIIEQTVKLRTGQLSPGQPLFYTNPPQEQHEQIGSISKDLFGAKDEGRSILTATHSSPSRSAQNGLSHSIAPPTLNTVTTATNNDQLLSSGLSQTDIDAYKMKEFVFGRIPEIPPTQTLI